MNLSRLFNFIGIPGLSVMGWLIFFGVLPAQMLFNYRFFGLIYGIGFPLVFCWIYIPIFRQKGWRTITEII